MTCFEFFWVLIGPFAAWGGWWAGRPFGIATGVIAAGLCGVAPYVFDWHVLRRPTPVAQTQGPAQGLERLEMKAKVVRAAAYVEDGLRRIVDEVEQLGPEASGELLERWW